MVLSESLTISAKRANALEIMGVPDVQGNRLSYHLIGVGITQLVGCQCHSAPNPGVKKPHSVAVIVGVEPLNGPLGTVAPGLPVTPPPTMHDHRHGQRRRRHHSPLVPANEL